MSPLTTHVLDLSRGVPGTGISIFLEKHQEREVWKRVGEGLTDPDGRVRTLLPEGSLLSAGQYRLTFQTAAYFKSQGLKSLFPVAVVYFDISETTSHLHIPLLLSPYGYTTYRGT